ncbi:unnamed protein product [Ambrosiozyma monospora]|uniref:Unnamed protein product n=1 Tax=Ambrosiozyma monospora TaxID=43982 RepID=A0ACB5ST92_AMBMO|nr:unnamed protein product [Ambrosiozyma monospora]
MLCRNWELPDVLRSMRSLEDRFNKDYHYTWTFLNDVDFTELFKLETTAMASGDTQYATIPAEDWNTPWYINETKYNECVKKFTEENIIYGFSKSYRNMCHFNSGYFYKQELLKNYDYYFRVEPGVEYFCDFQMDPFRLMREQKKKYGFVISIIEYEETIPTLWPTVEDFLHEYPDAQNANSAVEFVTNKEPIGFAVLDVETNSAYNLCHFWSNFEIGDLNFFRSDVYEAYFTYLSKSGGFHYERWGDAPVHSIAAALLLDKNEIHRFEDIGYYHNPFHTCPSSNNMRIGKRCICRDEDEDDEQPISDLEPNSCLTKWWKYGSGKRFIREYFHEEDYLEKFNA